MSKNLATKQPDYLTNVDNTLGNENVSADDLSIPEIKLMQSMSNELKKTHAKYIPDAKVGDITVGSDVFDEVFVTNLYYKKEYPIFDDNRGMVGNFKTRAAAEAYLAEQGLSTASNRIVETATHACLHVNAEGKALGPAIIRMSSTKLRVSNDWNAEITKTNVPRFASVWKLTPVEQSNAKGSWYNYSIENVGYPDEDTFNFAKAQYESIAPSSAAA